MSITNASSTVLTQGIKGLFVRELSGVTGALLPQRLATMAPSNARSETYAWLGQPSQMQEVDPSGYFTDNDAQPEPDIKQLSDTTYSITNKTFRNKLVIPRVDLEDDQIGGLALRVQQMVATGVGHKNALLTTLIENGTSGLCYDGTAFFGDSHTARKDEGGTQDNLLAGSGVTAANFQTDIGTGISTISTFKAENGEPFFSDMPMNYVLMAHPSQFAKVRVALGADLISNTSNVDFDGFSITPVFNARLSDTNDWYLFAVDGVRPFIWQDRVPLSLESKEKDEHFEYSLRARYNCGYGFWQKAVKFVNA